jgi:hypothetical protein
LEQAFLAEGGFTERLTESAARTEITHLRTSQPRILNITLAWVAEKMKWGIF